MTLFMPPIQRKKKVQEKYNPDSFRVISEDAQSDHPKYKPIHYRASFEPRTPTPKAFISSSDGKENTLEPIPPPQPLKYTRVLPRVLPDFRGNRPQTLSCGVLDKNVRFLNEPICNVYTKPVHNQEKDWWPSRANPGKLNVPPYAVTTENRCNYNLNQGERQAGSGRHTANSDRVAARGAAPVSFLREKDNSKRLFKEGISYEHMYNSRTEPNYPNRGKRHGGFVWSRMDPISERKFVEYYKKLAEQEKTAMDTSNGKQNGTTSKPQSSQAAKSECSTGKKSQSTSSVVKSESNKTTDSQPINEHSCE